MTSTHTHTNITNSRFRNIGSQTLFTALWESWFVKECCKNISINIASFKLYTTLSESFRFNGKIRIQNISLNRFRFCIGYISNGNNYKHLTSVYHQIHPYIKFYVYILLATDNKKVTTLEKKLIKCASCVGQLVSSHHQLVSLFTYLFSFFRTMYMYVHSSSLILLFFIRKLRLKRTNRKVRN